MKKGLVLVIGIFFIFTASAMAGAKVNVGTYNSDEHFTTKFWKEKFFGGGHGELGNVLMGIGKGFSFQNVALTGEPSPTGQISNPCDSADTTSYGYTTIYSGGYLKLNSKGPWLNSGKLKFPIEEATNISGKTDYGNGYRMFAFTFSGEDKTGKYYVDVTVTWCETEDNYDEKKKFHRGYDFYAEIEISEAGETVECPCFTSDEVDALIISLDTWAITANEDQFIGCADNVGHSPMSGYMIGDAYTDSNGYMRAPEDVGFIRVDTTISGSYWESYFVDVANGIHTGNCAIFSPEQRQACEDLITPYIVEPRCTWFD